MKPRDWLFQQKCFHVERQRSRIARIEAAVEEFSQVAARLDLEIAGEERRAGISDPGHFAYPAYAQAGRLRRDNLRRSITELEKQLVAARTALEAAVDEMRSPEIGIAKRAEAMRLEPVH